MWSAVDTLIEQESFFKKLISNKRKLVTVILLIAAVLFLINFLGTASVSKDLVRTAKVKRGNLTTEVEGSGVVKSTSLELHYSPIATYVKEIKLREGQLVNAGDTVLILDSSEIEKIIAAIENEMLIDQNNLRSKEIDFAQLELGNARRVQLAEANLKQHKYIYESAKKLHEIGGISESDLKSSEVEIERDQIELSFLTKEQKLNEDKLKQDIRTLRLTIENKRKELKFQKRRYEQSYVRSKVNGAIINQRLEAGQKISEGQLLSQISNLKSFVIEARFSQRYISQLSSGMPANIRINDKDYKGIVNLVQLEIKDGYGMSEIKFTANLPETIRQSQTAQVFVQTGFNENTLIVERGAFLNSGGRVAFKVSNSLAKQVPFKIGGRNYKYVEILSGLEEGDEIIVSRIDDYLDYKEFEIN
jgi:HlyD family secretion protein